jgi:hypothetical protein
MSMAAGQDQRHMVKTGLRLGSSDQSPDAQMVPAGLAFGCRAAVPGRDRIGTGRGARADPAGRGAVARSRSDLTAWLRALPRTA